MICFIDEAKPVVAVAQSVKGPGLKSLTMVQLNLCEFDSRSRHERWEKF